MCLYIDIFKCVFLCTGNQYDQEYDVDEYILYAVKKLIKENIESY